MTTAPHRTTTALMPIEELHPGRWRTANYLAVGMIYLQDNPSLRDPLQRTHQNRLKALARPSSGPMPTG